MKNAYIIHNLQAGTPAADYLNDINSRIDYYLKALEALKGKSLTLAEKAEKRRRYKARIKACHELAADCLKEGN